MPNAHGYPKSEKPADTTEANDWIDEIYDLAYVAGIKIDALDAAREQIEKARDLRKLFMDSRETRDQAIKRITAQLVNRELDLDTAALEAAKAESSVSGSILEKAIRGSEALAVRRSFAELARRIEGEDLLAECRDVAAKTLEEIRNLRKPLEGIRTADQATAGGPKTAAAWSRWQTELAPRWKAVHELVKRLRGIHWIDPLPTPLAPPGYVASPTYGRIDLYREDVRQAKQRREAAPTLLDPISDRWEPGGPATEAELIAAQEVLDAQRAAELEEEQRRIAAVGQVETKAGSAF